MIALRHALCSVVKESVCNSSSSKHCETPLVLKEKAMADDEPVGGAEDAAAYNEIQAVMSSAGVTEVEAQTLLAAARGSVDLAVVRAHNERRQREKLEERRAVAAEPGAELERLASADMVRYFLSANERTHCARIH